MVDKKRLVVFGAIVFFLGIVVMFPARVAYQLFAPQQFRLSAINGTIWSGSAAEGQADNLYLRDIRWSFKPWSILAGRLAFDASFNPAGGFMETGVGIGFDGSTTFSNLEGAVNIGALQNVLPAPGIDGNVRLQFAELTIEDGLPTSADGTVEIIGLVAKGLATMPIGDFRAELQTTDKGITGSVQDTAGMLDIAGALTISADRTYSLTGLVAPTASTPQSVTEQLRFLGSANERGQREFRFEGQL